jgi:hypothetical protein
VEGRFRLEFDNPQDVLLVLTICTRDSVQKPWAVSPQRKLTPQGFSRGDSPGGRCVCKRLLVLLLAMWGWSFWTSRCLVAPSMTTKSTCYGKNVCKFPISKYISLRILRLHYGLICLICGQLRSTCGGESTLNPLTDILSSSPYVTIF